MNDIQDAKARLIPLLNAFGSRYTGEGMLDVLLDACYDNGSPVLGVLAKEQPMGKTVKAMKFYDGIFSKGWRKLAEEAIVSPTPPSPETSGSKPRYMARQAKCIPCGIHYVWRKPYAIEERGGARCARCKGLLQRTKHGFRGLVRTEAPVYEEP